MKRRRFLFAAVLAAGSGLGTSPVHAQIAHINDAINKAGRQRMLSQRMAKFYQAINWGIAGPDTKSKLAEAREEFVAAHEQLRKSPKNTPEIRREFELAQIQWMFFDNALQATADNGALKKQLAVNVATTSERILEVMDRITGMYEKLA